MRVRSLMAAMALLGAIAAPGIAAAYTTAYSSPGTSNMRAGPGTDYPVIARVLGGSRVNVVGCLQNGSWCDVVVQDYRGWMSTTRLEFLYAGNLVPIPRYYAYFDVPVIGFDFGYWDRHYRDRSWYRDRDRWHHGGNRGRDRTPGVCLGTERCDNAGNWNGGGNWDGGGNGGGWNGGGNGGNAGGWTGGSDGGPVGAGDPGDGSVIGGDPGWDGGGDSGWNGGDSGGVVIDPGSGGGDSGGWDGGGNTGGGVVCAPDMPC